MDESHDDYLDENTREELIDDDEISPEEEGFLKGYEEDVENTTEEE